MLVKDLGQTLDSNDILVIFCDMPVQRGALALIYEGAKCKVQEGEGATNNKQ
jgi:hypothetical protein